jgi:hypothetical protein
MIKINRLFFPFSRTGIQIKSLNIFRKNFCVNVEVCRKNEEHKIEQEINNNIMYFSKLTKNIYKYLSGSCYLYAKLGEDSIKLAFDVSNEPSNDFLKDELIRINKQLNYLQREITYHDEIIRIISEISFNVELIKEASRSGDSDLVSNSKGELKKLNHEIVELENEIIEYLIPEEEVHKLFDKE